MITNENDFLGLIISCADDNHDCDAIEVIKLKEILHELERATDAAERVGKIIKTIIVKYT